MDSSENLVVNSVNKSNVPLNGTRAWLNGKFYVSYVCHTKINFKIKLHYSVVIVIK